MGLFLLTREVKRPFKCENVKTRKALKIKEEPPKTKRFGGF